MATILDGKAIARTILDDVAQEASSLAAGGAQPGLAVILVGNDPASALYVKNKRAACARAGVASLDHDLPEDIPEASLLALIAKLNDDPRVHGILVQLPLPRHLRAPRLFEAIAPAKDVDGFHPVNAGKLLAGEACLPPCTPAAIMRLIEETGVPIAGSNAVVVGRSAIVGKPAALMLLARHATVSICHSKTRDLEAWVRRADILVAAAGRPRLISGEWIKPGAVVIDVGINRTPEGKLVGDVEFEAAQKRAGFITPVPGGVGPMTIAMLVRNTVEAAKQQTRDARHGTRD